MFQKSLWLICLHSDAKFPNQWSAPRPDSLPCSCISQVPSSGVGADQAEKVGFGSCCLAWICALVKEQFSWLPLQLNTSLLGCPLAFMPQMNFLLMVFLFKSRQHWSFRRCLLVSLFRLTLPQKLFPGRCYMCRHCPAWKCAYLAVCDSVCARVCVHCQYSQLEKTRGQECSSIGKLWSCSWHSALMVILERERSTRADILRQRYSRH